MNTKNVKSKNIHKSGIDTPDLNGDLFAQVNPKAASGASTSERKKSANQQNAQQSTGPKTEIGKKRSSQNARKTGAYATQKFVWPGENKSAFARIQKGFFELYRPVGIREEYLVQDIVMDHWTLERIARLKYALFQDTVDQKWEQFDRLPEEASGIVFATLERSRKHAKANGGQHLSSACAFIAEHVHAQFDYGLEPAKSAEPFDARHAAAFLRGFEPDSVLLSVFGQKGAHSALEVFDRHKRKTWKDVERKIDLLKDEQEKRKRSTLGSQASNNADEIDNED